jgi:transcription antitermination factor NusG
MLSYWICCRTRYGDEFKKRDRLESIGFETYLPVRKTDIRTKRKCRTEVSPLYPPYLFVRVIEGITDIHPVKREAQIITFNGKPAEVKEYVMSIIRHSEKKAEQLKSEYSAGDLITLNSGILKDYKGIIMQLSRTDRAIIREITTGKEFEIKLQDVRPV